MDKELQAFSDSFEDVKKTPEYLLEGKIWDITYNINALMKERGISRAELARRIGVSRASVSRMLNGSTNYTLRKLSEVALALDADMDEVFVSDGAKTTKEVRELAADGHGLAAA